MWKFLSNAQGAKMKAISPIVATVLLIAIVIVIAGIMNIWLSNFTKSTKDINSEAEGQTGCSNAKILFQNIKYCNGSLSGIIYNEGMGDLGNLTIYVLYQNGTQQKNDLNKTLNAGYMTAFNMTMNSGYSYVELLTNCTVHGTETIIDKIVAC
jgi:flagellin-like protein